MGVLDWLFRRSHSSDREHRSIQNPAVPLSGRKILEYLGAASNSTSGIAVNGRTSLGYSPVWQAVSLITRDIAKLPFLVWKRSSADGTEGAKHEEALGHPAYRLLYVSTGLLTPNHWLKAMLCQALLKGNGFSWIRRDGAMRPLELVLLPSDLVTIRHERGVLNYEVKPDQSLPPDTPRRVQSDDIFHLRGLTPDGLGGLSIVEYARNSFGRNLAIERYGEDFFANNGEPSGWFTHPGEMGEEAIDTFLKTMRDAHAGHGNRHKSGVLEEGMEWKPTGISPRDALLVDAMGFGVKEVARWFCMPAHKLGDNAKTSYSSIEQENRAYFDSTLCTWISDLEIEANAKLLTEGEQATQSHFVRATTSELLRADTKTRMEAHKIAIEAGIKSPNEVREEEGLNPYDGGDEYIRPLNMSTVGDEPDESPNANQQTDGTDGET